MEIYTNDWLNFGYSDMDFEKEKKLTVTFKKIFEYLFLTFSKVSNWDKLFDKDIKIYLISRNKKFEVVAGAGCCSLHFF